MISILGRAPILDFDGTIARLAVDWHYLRRSLGVASINDLWTTGGASSFVAVTTAEVKASARSDGIPEVLAALAGVEAFAVLTNNSAAAVHRFLEERTSIGHRLVLVVGRDQLGGPKSDFDRFEVGFRLCLNATATARRAEPPVYVGDSPYELDFAQRLGATVVPVKALIGEGRV